MGLDRPRSSAIIALGEAEEVAMGRRMYDEDFKLEAGQDPITVTMCYH